MNRRGSNTVILQGSDGRRMAVSRREYEQARGIVQRQQLERMALQRYQRLERFEPPDPPNGRDPRAGRTGRTGPDMADPKQAKRAKQATRDFVQWLLKAREKLVRYDRYPIGKRPPVTPEQYAERQRQALRDGADAGMIKRLELRPPKELVAVEAERRLFESLGFPRGTRGTPGTPRSGGRFSAQLTMADLTGDENLAHIPAHAPQPRRSPWRREQEDELARELAREWVRQGLADLGAHLGKQGESVLARDARKRREARAKAAQAYRR